MTTSRTTARLICMLNFSKYSNKGGQVLDAHCSSGDGMWAHQSVCSALLLKAEYMHVHQGKESTVFWSAWYTDKHSLSSAPSGMLSPISQVGRFYLPSDQKIHLSFYVLQMLPITIQNFSSKNIFFLKVKIHWTAPSIEESSKWKHLGLRNWKCQLQTELLLFFLPFLAEYFHFWAFFFLIFICRIEESLTLLLLFCFKNIQTDCCNQPMASKQPSSNVIHMSPKSPKCSWQFNELCPVFHQNTYEPYWAQQSC